MSVSGILTKMESMLGMKIKLDEGAYMPEKAHDLDAGYDLRSPSDFVLHGMIEHSAGMITVDTGVHIEIPKGYCGVLKSKSGLNVNHDIIGSGVIDAGYTGSIRVKLYNLGYKPHNFKRGDKLIQLVIYPIMTPELELAEEIEGGERGSQGFGSTGV